MTFHQFDGEGWHKFQTLDEAYAACETSLREARDVAIFDEEWPDWTEDIAVYEAPSDSEDPCGDGKPVVKTIMTDIRNPEPGEGDDFYCDFRLGKLIETID